MATKTEKLTFSTTAGSKLTYVGKVPKIIFEKIERKIDWFLSIFGWKST